MNEPIIGIDLGTTNSEVAVVQNGQVTVIAANGHKILPSAVGLTPENILLVGEEAKNQHLIYPERTVLSIKRKMGTLEKVTLGEAAYSPQEISAMILKQLKNTAEAYLQCPITKAVITVPAYFSDAQRQATREAGGLAGLEVVRMINEPTAAALAYDTHQNEQKRVLVYDLGGGTFDVSIVSLQNNVVEVLASGGNNNLGGDDFDTKIIEFIQNNLTEQGIDISQSPKAQARIRRAAEIAKITLSDHPFAKIEEEYLMEHQGKPYHLSMELSRSDYEDMIKPYINETVECVQKALNDANLMSSDIDDVLLVGGSTRTPIIAEELNTIFNHRPRAEIDPELCVATGAAIQAGVIAGEKCNAILVDVTPYTFGTSCIGIVDDEPYPSMFKPIILKNTPIPVTKSEVFFTLHDDQDAVGIKVYQGENEDALENIKIGEFKVEGLSKAPANSPIVITFKLDLDGILQVSAQEKKTGLEKKIIISNAIAQFNQAEIDQAKQRIDQLFTEPCTAEHSHAALHHNAEQLIVKAEKLLGEISAEDQEDLVNLMEVIKDALSSHQETELPQHLEQLSDMLHYLDVETV